MPGIPLFFSPVEEEPHGIESEPQLPAAGGEELPPPQYDDVVSEAEEELQRVILELSGLEQATGAEFVLQHHNEENELESIREDSPPAYDITQYMP